MPDLVSVLKDEIRRLARKEVKAQVGETKQAVSQYRRDIADLKRQLRDANKKIRVLESRGRADGASSSAAVEEPEEKLRFSAKSVKKHRDRLGLSAKDFGLLIGVSGLTVYNWEHGKSRPRRAQLASLATVRTIGKREATARLQALEEGGAAAEE